MTAFSRRSNCEAGDRKSVMDRTIRIVILLGAPGSGKGTVAEQISAQTQYVHVSTGDMLRDAVARGTEVGMEAESYMKRGELVPDEVMIRVVEARLDVREGSGLYMFDGFPRTAEQAELLEQAMASRSGEISRVLFLDAPRDVLVSRLTGRRVCKDCGATYHVVNIPPRQEGVCDKCGGELYQRPDDSEETIANRLEVYNRQTESLIARYDEKGILSRVDSSQQAAKLVADVMALL